MKKQWPKIRRMLKTVLILPFVADLKTTLNFYLAVLTSIPDIIRERNFRAPYSKMWSKPCTFRFLGNKVTLDGVSFGYAVEIYVRKCYTRMFAVQKNDTVLDLGSALGVFTIGAAMVAKRVLAVDIIPESIEKLKQQAKLNNCLDKIEVVLGAAGPATGLCVEEIKRTPAIKIGRLLQERNIQTVDFLKVDIDGSEFDLFQNDNDWLYKVKKIVMEVHAGCGDVRELRKVLDRNGFKHVLQDLDWRTVDEVVGDACYLFAVREPDLV